MFDFDEMADSKPTSEVNGTEQRNDQGMPTARFNVGDLVESTGTMIVRAGEDLQSSQLRRLPGNCKMRIVKIGTGPTGKRLQIRDDSDQTGWVSAVGADGLELLKILKIVQEDAAAMQSSHDEEEKDDNVQEVEAPTEKEAPAEKEPEVELFAGEGHSLGRSTGSTAAANPRAAALAAAEQRQASSYAHGISDKKAEEMKEKEKRELLSAEITKIYTAKGEEVPLPIRTAGSKSLQKHLDFLQGKLSSQQSASPTAAAAAGSAAAAVAVAAVAAAAPAAAAAPSPTAPSRTAPSSASPNSTDAPGPTRSKPAVSSTANPTVASTASPSPAAPSPAAPSPAAPSPAAPSPAVSSSAGSGTQGARKAFSQKFITSGVPGGDAGHGQGPAQFQPPSRTPNQEQPQPSAAAPNSAALTPDNAALTPNAAALTPEELRQQYMQQAQFNFGLNEEQLQEVLDMESMGFEYGKCLEAFLTCERNQEMAINLLLEGLGDEAEEAAAGQPASTQQAVPEDTMLSLAEWEAVRRIEELGFDRPTSLQTFLQYNRSEEDAANMLLM